MNLNGAEYYYVRNAQGDIIGLIDAQGEKVVSYIYDSWGKLISIEGSLKDTVGEKNPYRYRGYRYDSETGLYYLQNRYYNPEWGRFINADGIIGETGELLGHNLFAYSKNNWANMSDYSGFRPVYTLGEETEAMRAASYAVMNRVTRNRWRGSTATKSTSKAKKFLNICGQVGASIGDAAVNGYVGSKLSRTVAASYKCQTKYFKWPNGIPTAYYNFPKVSIGLKVASKVAKAGVISCIGLGVGAWDNFSHYKNDSAWKRTAVDGIAFAGTVGASAGIGVVCTALALPGVVAGLAGFGAGVAIIKVAGWVKDKWFNDKK